MASGIPRTKSVTVRKTAEEIAERRAQVYALHLAGGSVRKIAAALEIPQTTVQDDITAVIRSRTWEETQHLRKGAQGRIESYLAEHLRLYHNAVAAGNPDLANRLMQTIVSIEERRAKLEGTDAPTRIRVTEFTDADLDDAIAARRAQLRAVQPDHPLLARSREQPAIGPGGDDRREAGRA